MKNIITLAFILFARFLTADPLPYPVGNVTLVGGAVQLCPSGATCSNISVDTLNDTCKAIGMIGVFEPTVPEVGTVLMFGGGNGGAPYTYFATNTFILSLTSQGYRVVEFWWNYTGWAQSQTCAGNVYPIQAASRISACIKYAALTRWPNTPIMIGLGGSAGSSAISYALAFYGADRWLRLAILQSTNPMMEVFKGCEDGYPGYTFPPGTPAIGIMNSLFHNTSCGTGQVDQHWYSDSVENGGNYSYPNVIIRPLLGGRDDTYILNRGYDWINLITPGTPNLLPAIVVNVGHAFMGYAIGEAAVRDSIFNDWKTGTPSPTPNPSPTPTIPPVPTPTATCTCP